MRILQVCSAREIGGGERHFADLSNALGRRGHNVFAALAPDSPLISELKLPPENVLFSRLRNALDVFSAFELARFARENEIELIHAHLARDYNLAAAASQITKVPFVLTRHVLFPLNSLNKYALRRVRGVIAVSNAVAKSLTATFPPEKITTIHNGIDLARFPFVPKPANQNLRIGTIGHLAPIKGHDIFIAAAKIVCQQLENAEFVIVGEDKSKTGENRRKIENLIAEFKLSEKIELKGWTQDVRPILSNFDLFVSSARSEPFGLVLLEAMACGVPIVATRTEGAREIIEDNESGVLVPLENAQLLAEKIIELLSSPAKRENLSKKARQRVEAWFSLEKMVSETENFYLRVTGKQ